MHTRTPTDALPFKAIVDFSFDAETMADLGRRSKSFIVLDHHYSAEHALKGVPDSDKVFEMKMSGCTLAWDYFHGADKPVRQHPPLTNTPHVANIIPCQYPRCYSGL
jgi:hypothetical protein